MFAVVFGLSMDYEVFLISRVREQWMHRDDASDAVADGIAVHRARDHRGGGDHDLRVPVVHARRRAHAQGVRLRARGGRASLDALVVRCVLLPAVLELLGRVTWWLPRWLDARLPHINIEGSVARPPAVDEAPAPPSPEPTATR